MRVKSQSGRPARGQEGSALLLTLAIGGIITIHLVAYLSLVDQQNRSIMRSQAWNYSMAVAEAGVEEAMAQLNRSWSNLEANDWVKSDDVYLKRGNLNGNIFQVAISNVNPPVIYSQAFVPIPNSTNYLTPRAVRVTTASSALFAKGIVAKGSIDLSGNNLTTDSFDSADPAHSTNGLYDPAKAKDNGDVATNSTLTNSLNVGNAKIWGRASTGPGGSVAVGPNGAVGNRNWQSVGSKGVQPGAYADDMNVSFRDVQAPFGGGWTPFGWNVNGTNYQYVLGTGNYRLSSLSLSGQDKMLVYGKAVLYVVGGLSLSGESYIYLSPGATLTLYVGGPTASLGGTGIANASGNATNLIYYGLPSNTRISLSGNAAFTGLIYAPSAALTLGGGGSDPYDFVGAAIANTVQLNGHYGFHYDENLARVGPVRGFVVTSWAEL